MWEKIQVLDIFPSFFLFLSFFYFLFSFFFFFFSSSLSWSFFCISVFVLFVYLLNLPSHFFLLSLFIHPFSFMILRFLSLFWLYSLLDFQSQISVFWVYVSNIHLFVCFSFLCVAWLSWTFFTTFSFTYSSILFLSPPT